MEPTDIPIFKKLYELYKLMHAYRAHVPKVDRYSLWQRTENNCLELLELILSASSLSKEAKLPILQTASVKLNNLRFFIRLAKDTRAIDPKKYLALQSLIDEIGRMLGGWLRSVKPETPPPLLARGRPSGLKSSSNLVARQFRAHATPMLELAFEFQLLTLKPFGLPLTFTRLRLADANKVCQFSSMTTGD